MGSRHRRVPAAVLLSRLGWTGRTIACHDIAGRRAWVSVVRRDDQHIGLALPDGQYAVFSYAQVGRLRAALRDVFGSTG